MNAYQDFGSKQEEALATIREEVREGKVQLEDALSKLDDKMVGIFDYLDAMGVSWKALKKPDVPMVLWLKKLLTTPQLHHFERALDDTKI